MNNDLLKKYAELTVKTGINVQKGQTLVIDAPVESAAFVRMAAEIAYDEGARDVVVNFEDDLLTRIRFLKAPEEVFSEFPQWEKELYTNYAREGAAFLFISAADPELLKGVDPQRIAKKRKTGSIALKEFRERYMSSKNAWSIVAIPSSPWARKVFPGLSEEQAVEKLWDAILKAVRVDREDPAAAWREHINNLKKNMDFLNSNRFRFLHYKNSEGTDLKIEFSENHVWLGGSEFTPEGVEFVANMPTEEVFTMPLKTGANGTVVSTMPLSYNGNLIDKFSIVFENGRIVDFKAEKGYDILKSIIDTDEGSRYLGEVALVPYDSPISNSKILFYNTLFDENASCHLAIGKAYSSCLKNGENMSASELAKAGANDSLVHVDFMIGSKDLEIMGITFDGREIPVFKNGNFIRNVIVK